MKIVIVTMVTALMVLLTSAISLAQNDTEIKNIGTNISGENIVEVAAANGNFDTLVNATDVAEISGILSGPGPYTLFAPTDEAFAKIPQAQLNDLITSESQRNNLKSILTYHIVSGVVLPSDFKNGMALKTMEGSDLLVTIDNVSVMVDGVRIVRPMINASNGVIYAIDTVLIPPAVSATTNIIGAAETTKESTSGKEVSGEQARSAAVEENVTKQEASKSPGFGAFLAALGILAVAFLSLGRRD